MVEDPSGGAILVGGQSREDQSLNTLFQIADASEDAKWFELPQKLTVGRHLHSAFLVPKDVSTCSLT
jgi:hypothetical protein